MEATMVLDTKRAKEMMATATASAAPRTGTTQAEASQPQHLEPLAPPKDRTATLTVVDGKTDAKQYHLTGKMSVIGKSSMASIKLKGFFAPNMAALINKRDSKYFIAASETKIKVKINGQEIAGQKELNEGDLIEVAGVKMTFGYGE